MIFLLVLLAISIFLNIFLWLQFDKYKQEATKVLHNTEFIRSIYSNLIINAPFSILIEKIDGSILVVNEAFCTLLGINMEPSNMEGKMSKKIIGEVGNLFPNFDEFMDTTEKLVKGRVINRNEEIKLNDGRILERDYIPLILENMHRGNIWIYRDVSHIKQHEIELERDNRELWKLTNLDPLTNLSNRRYMDKVLADVWKECQQNEEQMNVLLIEIDFFKRYNDTYGYIKGDRVLKDVTAILHQVSHSFDAYIGRYSGIVLISVIVGTTRDSEKIANKILAEVEKIRIPNTKSTRGYITVSIGMANTKDNIGTVEDLVVAASGALNQAKWRGGNCWRSVDVDS